MTALFGRSAELARLRGWLAEAVGGLPQVVVCSGEAGIGKTRLLEALSDEAESGGALVLWARSPAPASAPPYWLWRQLFGTDAVIGPVPVAGPVPVGTVPAGDRVALFERLAGRLIETAAVGGAVMVVDDIHWADEPSLVALLHVVRTLHRARLLVCVAERSGGADSSDGWRGARSSLIREPHAHLLELHGLSRAGSAELLRELLGRSMPEHVVSQAHAICAGNPFYLREVARARNRVAGSDVELPATLAGVVEQHLEQLTPRTRELLRASSILGEEFSIAIAARLLGRSVFGCLPDIDEAISAGVLSAAAGDRVRFTHALVRAALESGLSLRVRVRLHGRAVRAIEQLYADALPSHLADLARHAAAAAVGGDRRPAMEWARRAGDEAMRALAFEEAARLYVSALEIGADVLSDAERGRLLVDRAAAEHRSGRLNTARATCGDAIVIARRTRDHQVLAQAALTLEPAGDRAMDRDILDWCREALEVPGPTPGIRAQLLARLTEAMVYCGEWDDAIATSSAALSAADDADDADALVAALRARQLACSGPDQVDERARLATVMIATGQADHRPDVEMWGRFWAIDAHMERGRIHEAALELDRVRWCVDRAGGPMPRWLLLRTWAAIAQARAEFAEALRLGAEAYELASVLDHPAAQGSHASLLAGVGHHIGHTEMSRKVPLTDVLGGVAELFALLGPAYALADSGEIEPARALYRLTGPPPQWTIPPYFVLGSLAMGAQIAVAVGADEDAGYFRERLNHYRGHHIASGAGTASYLGPVELHLGKCAAALQLWADAVAELTEAATISRGIGAPSFAVEADTERAELLARQGDVNAARQLAAALLPAARSLGMSPWVTRLQRLAPTPLLLSPREAEVARLVATGSSNRDIAARLVISDRTAQNHVQHILTKLGFSHRSQIAAWVTAEHADE
ncbi:MAG TPA: AAA family ATPase [Propionibacteriaceae bacterium]